MENTHPALSSCEPNTHACVLSVHFKVLLECKQTCVTAHHKLAHGNTWLQFFVEKLLQVEPCMTLLTV